MLTRSEPSPHTNLSSVSVRRSRCASRNPRASSSNSSIVVTRRGYGAHDFPHHDDLLAVTTRGRHGMPKESVVARLSELAAATSGAFRGEAANAVGVSATQPSRLARDGVIERLLPNTYRMVAVPRSSEQQLHAALLWAGDRAAVAGRSAAERYRFEGVRARLPE